MRHDLWLAVLPAAWLAHLNIDWRLLIYRDHFVHAPSQWEMTLQCNIISHWLGAYTKWSLHIRSAYAMYSGLMLPVGISTVFQRPGGVRPGFFTIIPLATETEGQNGTLGYGKCVKIKPLTIGNVTRLTTFEAILHEIGQICPKSCHLHKKNGGFRSKWPKFAENIPLTLEIGLKKGPLRAAHPQ